MIRCERKVARAALKLSNRNSNVLLFYCAGSNCLGVSGSDSSIILKLSPDDIALSIKSLSKRGFFNIVSTAWGGDTSFSITFALKHRKAFILEDFSRRFWIGFAVGFASAFAAGVLIQIILQI